jgi:hypothetical protein
MKRNLSVFVISLFLLAACSCVAMPGRAHSTPVEPDQTPTPTPPGSWQMVMAGEIYDSATGDPIAGAAVYYEVVHSYFPEIQAGWPKETTSDAQGQFRLPMIVHDTDHLRLVVTAPNYKTYAQKLDLFGDRYLRIGLTPE